MNKDAFSALQVRAVEQSLTRSQRSDRDARGLRMSQADRLRRNRPFGREAIFCGGPSANQSFMPSTSRLIVPD